MQNRWKSPVLWSSLAALACFSLNNWGILSKLGLDVTSFKNLIDLALGVLVAVGIINNPTEGGNL